MARRRVAYTLTELAILLAVVVLLAGILLPSFRRARANARRASCASNMKQIGLAVLMYEQDYDERVPAPWRGLDSRFGQAYTWRAMIYPYMRNQQILFCPDQQGDETHRWDPQLFSRDEWKGWSSYGANVLHSPPGPPTEYFNDKVVLDPTQPRRQTVRGLIAVAAPAETLMLGETAGLPWIEAPWQDGHFGLAEIESGDGGIVTRRHRGQANYVYADGHARWLEPGKVKCTSGGGADRCPWSVE
ncbi:MAG: DUF1559 domain-containing protein [Armatimonadetes bacterium]|nr:DUF1559 domain-containing protein [Armatimonadota bacterium]